MRWQKEKQLIRQNLSTKLVHKLVNYYKTVSYRYGSKKETHWLSFNPERWTLFNQQRWGFNDIFPHSLSRGSSYAYWRVKNTIDAKLTSNPPLNFVHIIFLWPKKNNKWWRSSAGQCVAWCGFSWARHILPRGDEHHKLAWMWQMLIFHKKNDVIYYIGVEEFSSSISNLAFNFYFF